MANKRGSKNRDRPSYRFSTGEEYSALYSRIQRSFNIDEMTPERLAEWLKSSNHPLIDQLMAVKLIGDEINKAESLAELNELKTEVSSLPTHKFELANRIENRSQEIIIIREEERINRSITLTNRFAKEKNIVLSEKVRGGIYKKWGRYGREAIVIFSKGKIKSWKYT